jgi:hypothetical protein
MLTFHIIAMVSTTIGAVVKTILLFFSKKNFIRFQSVTKWPIISLLITGALAGIYLIVSKFGGIVPPWLMIKLTLFITGGLMASFGEKKENKIIVAVGTLMLVLVIVQANVKLNY